MTTDNPTVDTLGTCHPMRREIVWPPEEVEKHGFQIIQFEPKDSSAQRPKVGIGVKWQAKSS